MTGARFRRGSLTGGFLFRFGMLSSPGNPSYQIPWVFRFWAVTTAVTAQQRTRIQGFLQRLRAEPPDMLDGEGCLWWASGSDRVAISYPCVDRTLLVRVDRYCDWNAVFGSADLPGQDEQPLSVHLGSSDLKEMSCVWHNRPLSHPTSLGAK